MTSFLDDPSRIEVHAFGVVAEVITAHQLQELGKAGFELIDGWTLNVRDYGRDKKYFMFRRFGV